MILKKVLALLHPSNASCGENDIPAKVLRQCRANLSYPIYLIWEESLNEGKILSPHLKDQLITPLHKKGSRADPAEYRPISLTSHLSKIFKRIMRDRIVSHMEYNLLLCNSQHGSRKRSRQQSVLASPALRQDHDQPRHGYHIPRLRQGLR